MTTDRLSSAANGDGVENPGDEQERGRRCESPTTSPYSPIYSTGILKRLVKSQIRTDPDRTEVSRKINELRETVEGQERLLLRLLERLDGAGEDSGAALGGLKRLDGGVGQAKGVKES